MSKPVSTHLTISFSSNLGGDVLQLSVDDRVDGPGRGITTFYPGDTVYIQEFRSPNVTIEHRFVTDGGLVAVGEATMVVEEFVTAVNTKSFNTDRPIYADFTILKAWGMPVSVTGMRGNLVSIAEPAIAVLQVRYVTRFTVLRLSGASGEAPVLVYSMGIAE